MIGGFAVINPYSAENDAPQSGSEAISNKFVIPAEDEDDDAQQDTKDGNPQSKKPQSSFLPTFEDEDEDEDVFGDAAQFYDAAYEENIPAAELHEAVLATHEQHRRWWIETQPGYQEYWQEASQGEHDDFDVGLCLEEEQEVRPSRKRDIGNQSSLFQDTWQEPSQGEHDDFDVGLCLEEEQEVRPSRKRDMGNQGSLFQDSWQEASDTDDDFGVGLCLEDEEEEFEVHMQPKPVEPTSLNENTASQYGNFSESLSDLSTSINSPGAKRHREESDEKARKPVSMIGPAGPLPRDSSSLTCGNSNNEGKQTQAQVQAPFMPNLIVDDEESETCVEEIPRSLPATTEEKEMGVVHAKQQLLQALAIEEGDMDSSKIKEAMAPLFDYYASWKWDARDADGYLHATTSQHVEGMWLTLSKPTYGGNLGTNDAGEPMYRLGRMSFDMFCPTQLVCSIQGTFNPVEQVTDHTVVESVPKSLQKDIEKQDTVLRTYK